MLPIGGGFYKATALLLLAFAYVESTIRDTSILVHPLTSRLSTGSEAKNDFVAGFDSLLTLPTVVLVYPTLYSASTTCSLAIASRPLAGGASSLGKNAPLFTLYP